MATKKSPISIGFPYYYRTGTQYAELISGDTYFGRGDLFDNCKYINQKPSVGEIEIDLMDGSVIKIGEHRYPTILSVGDPYYINYIYYSDTLSFGEEIRQAGPYRDTVYSGAGTWKIVSSTNPVIVKASGTLVYSSHNWYGTSLYFEGDVITLNDIVKNERLNSKLDGSYQ